MKSWLARAVANTVLQGADRGTWGARWFPPARAVDDASFQHAGEPYPRHWRALPQPWPTTDPAEPEITAPLRDAVDELPKRWRSVVLGQSQVDLTEPQRRDIRNHAVARLRQHLARLLHREAGR